MIKYTFKVEINLGRVLPSVGESLDSVNNIMKCFGFGGELIARSTLVTGSINVDRLLSRSELTHIREIIEESFNRTQPDWGASISSLQCEGGVVDE